MLRTVSRAVLSRQIKRVLEFRRYSTQKGNREQPWQKKGRSKNGMSLLSSVEKFLLYSPPAMQKNAEPFIHRRLKEDKFHTPDRPLILENLISLLIHHRRFKEAGTVYERLSKEGHISSHRTDAQMLAMGLVASPDTANILESLDLIFAAEEFTEDDFILLMGMYKDLHLPPALSIHTIQRFIACRGEGYVPHLRLVNLLAGLLVREGRASEAFDVVDRYDARKKEDDLDRAHPYASMIASLDTFDPLSLQSVDDVLETIRRKEIQVDNSLVNTLIAKQTEKGSMEKAFELYHALVDASRENPSISPDFFTFRNLFRLLFEKKKTSSAATPPVPPRQLYFSMLSTHFSAARKNSKRTLQVDLDQDQSLLHIALQTFLAYDDYPAAYVVIRAFSDFGIPLSLMTYNRVLVRIAFRVRQNIFDGTKWGGCSWGHRLLGLSPTDFRKLNALTLRDVNKAKSSKQKLMEILLRQSQCPGLVFTPSNKPLPQSSMQPGSVIVPSNSMLIKKAVPPPFTLLDSRPLERMLRRATLALMEEQRPLISRVEHVARRIEEAKEEMIPKDVELRPRRPLHTYYLRKTF